MKIASEDTEFRKGLLVSAINLALEGEVLAGKISLRDYIKSSDVMDDLCATLEESQASVGRMIAPAGKVTLENFVRIISTWVEREGMKLEVK